MANKTWGGRFQTSLHPDLLRFSASVHFDKRLALHDIRGSLAHARMLGAQGILSAEDVAAIERGLESIRGDIEAGRFEWSSELEDVHMNIETELRKRIGEAGGKLHTARSRNDQVATDMRLWTRDACDTTVAAIDALLHVLVEVASRHVDVLMPGYTHLQRAQPVRLAHHLLAWAEMLERDRGRFEDARQRLNECPLGSGALSTTTFPIDRTRTAKELGFDRPTANSLDSVADRDYLVEVLAALSCTAVHLSRISEEIVLWTSQEFGFAMLSDAFATGSSMMPQKKNPDVAELVRGRTGRIVGDLVALLVLLKGLPLSYNRDLQEDKEPVFHAFDSVGECLLVVRGALESMTFNADVMRRALREGFLDATELADYLAARGVPFRDAHHVAGELVHDAQLQQKTISELSLDELRKRSPQFENDIYDALSPERMVERRNVVGGPAKAQVESALATWRKRLATRSSK